MSSGMHVYGLFDNFGKRTTCGGLVDELKPCVHFLVEADGILCRLIRRCV